MAAYEDINNFLLNRLFVKFRIAMTKIKKAQALLINKSIKKDEKITITFHNQKIK